MLDLQLRGEVGAFQERRIELIRGGETNVVASDKGIPFAGVRPSWALWKKAEPLPCAVKVSWVAWGEPGSSAVVRQESFDAVAAAPVSAWIALPVVSLALIFFACRLGFNNSLLGQEVQWGTHPGGQDAGCFLIGVFSRARFSLWGKTVLLSLPENPSFTFGAEDPLAWMDGAAVRQDRISYEISPAEEFLSCKKQLKVELSSPGIWKVVPFPPARDTRPIYFNITQGLGELNRAMLALLAVLLILFIAANCSYFLVWHAWPQY